MNAVLTAKGLSAGHADRVIFSGADLVVSPGLLAQVPGTESSSRLRRSGRYDVYLGDPLRRDGETQIIDRLVLAGEDRAGGPVYQR